MPACIPAEVGLPRNHSAEPVKAGRSVIIGIQVAAVLAVITKPCAVSGSALMTSMLTRAPAGTTIAGLVMPTARNVSSGPPDGLASTVRRAIVAVKVRVFAARSARAPAGTWAPSVVACAALTRGPGAFAHRL